MQTSLKQRPKSKGQRILTRIWQDRVLYLLLYWIDLAWQRSLVWVVGLLCSLLLMLSPALA